MENDSLLKANHITIAGQLRKSGSDWLGKYSGYPGVLLIPVFIDGAGPVIYVKLFVYVETMFLDRLNTDSELIRNLFIKQSF